MSLNSSRGRVCRQRAACVAGAGSGKLFQAICSGHRDRHRHAACLERTGGIQAFVLDEDIGELTTGQHGSEAFAESHGKNIGQDFCVTPEGGDTALEDLRLKVLL